MFNKYYYFQRHKSGALWWAEQSDDAISYAEYQEIMGNIFGSNFEAAEKFHSSIKNDSGINVLAALNNSYFVIGINQPTIGALIFNEGNSLSSLECVDLMYELTPGAMGDGTVPYYSATMDTYVYNLSSRYLKVSDNHSDIVKNSKALNWLTDILSSGNSNISDDAVDTNKYVVVRIACPVEVEIERDGEVLSSDLEAASFITSFGRIDLTGQDAEIKMLCLRADEIDTLNLSGTDDGEMDMSLRWFDEDGQLTDERVFRDIALSPTTSLITTTDNTGDTVLSIDEDSDGQIDSTVTVGANSTVSANISFVDVPTDAYYYDAVLWAVENDITSGTSATTFSPNNSCTRAQIVSFLYRAAGSPAVTASNPFTDVKESDYYYSAVLWAVENGITSGTTATTFSPGKKCTRSEAVAFLYRAKNTPPVSGTNSFTDVASDIYYADAVQWAVDTGVTAGTSSTKFSPNQTCTRAQIVSFLYRDRVK